MLAPFFRASPLSMLVDMFHGSLSTFGGDGVCVIEPSTPPNDNSGFPGGDTKGLRVSDGEPNESNDVEASEEAAPKGMVLDSDVSWPRVDL